MHKTVRRVATYGAAVGAVVAVTAAAPAAYAEQGGNSGWEQTFTPPFHLAAGESCAFELQADVLYDHEITRVTEEFPDGSPRVVDTQGALGFRFTNVATGESIERSASGTLRATIGEDGGVDFRFRGGGLAVIRSPNSLTAPGVYVLAGNVDYVRHADGQREFAEVNGTLENVCQTLA